MSVHIQRILVALLIAIVGAISTSAIAHPGRTDTNGCHVEKKTGQRHCH